MSATGDLKRRRRPQQERGKAAVESILSATSRLLDETGFDALTTAAIAERAGVNIATLYRYFPNKFTIVSELAEQLESERSAASVDALRGLPTAQDWRVPLRTAIDAVADLRESQVGNRAIRRALQSSPALWDLDHDSIARTAAQIAPFLTARGASLDDAEAADIALVVVSTVTTLLDLVNDAPDQAPRIHHEMLVMIERYLAPYFDA